METGSSFTVTDQKNYGRALQTDRLRCSRDDWISTSFSQYPRSDLINSSRKDSLEGHAPSCPKYLGTDGADALQIWSISILLLLLVRFAPAKEPRATLLSPALAGLLLILKPSIKREIVIRNYRRVGVPNHDILWLGHSAYFSTWNIVRFASTPASGIAAFQ